MVAALYIALGQDPAHVVEGSLARLDCLLVENGIQLTLEMPAVLVGTVGGGTALPAQKQLLALLQLGRAGQSEARSLAEVVSTAVLAGEISLLAALSSGELTQAHTKLAR